MMATQLVPICRCCELADQLDYLLARPDRSKSVAERFALTVELEAALVSLEGGLDACDSRHLALSGSARN